MKEKTFEELTKPYRFYGANSLEELIIEENVLTLLQQVREATSEEFCQALLGVTLPAEAVKKIGKIVTTTDRILTDK